MSQPISAALLSIFCLVCAAETASAEATPYDTGDAPSALPGIVRVGVPAPNRLGVAAAGTAGYGFTESILAQNDKHNRVFGSVAASFRPNDWFAAALRIDGRYDWHRDVPDGNGGGAVGEPRFLLRAASGSNDFRFGAEAGVRFPGKEAPSVSFSAVSPEVSLLAAYVPASGSIALGSQLGFRYDRSAESVENPDRLMRADRMSLGVSDTNAVLLGVGLTARISKDVQALAEWTWDVRVPSKGVGAGQSPMRVDLGGRYFATDTLALELVAEVSPSSRPPVGIGAPLAVIEPRFAIFAGINVRPSLPVVEAAPIGPVTQPEKPAEVASVARIEGKVTDEGGRPIVGAKVHAAIGAQAAPSNTTGKADAGGDATTNDFGAFELAGIPTGKVDITARAEGYRDATKTIDLAASGQSLEIQLERALPQGQIRGLARSFAGQPIKGATVRIDPIGKEVQVGEGGRFEVDVPPGEYDVIVKATGYADQHRHVRVEANGVVVLDLDMRTRR